MAPEAVLPEQLLAQRLVEQGLRLAVAESCTGGLIGHRLTEIPGSSEFFDRSLVVYSNRAKIELLGVPEAVIETEGAVSEACARALWVGLMARSPADLGVAVTGIAGPGGGTDRKPVGTVWFAWGRRGAPRAELRRFAGSRRQIKADAAEHALRRLLESAEEPP